MEVDVLHCLSCGRYTGRVQTVCDVCKRPVCPEHSGLLTLVRKEHTSVIRACNDCIQKHNLEVIDPNHPLYLNHSHS